MLGHTEPRPQQEPNKRERWVKKFGLDYFHKAVTEEKVRMHRILPGDNLQFSDKSCNIVALSLDFFSPMVFILSWIL